MNDKNNETAHTSERRKKNVQLTKEQITTSTAVFRAAHTNARFRVRVQVKT